MIILTMFIKCLQNPKRVSDFSVWGRWNRRSREERIRPTENG